MFATRDMQGVSWSARLEHCTRSPCPAVARTWNNMDDAAIDRLRKLANAIKSATGTNPAIHIASCANEP